MGLVGMAHLRLTGPFEFWMLTKDDHEDECENEAEGPACVDADRLILARGRGGIKGRLARPVSLGSRVPLLIVPPRVEDC